MIKKIKPLFDKSENDLTQFIECSDFFKLSIKGEISFILIEKKVENIDIKRLLEKLWCESYEIAFHDTIHPTLSDPGAYFSYSTKKSTKENVWSMTYGNHGWSGGIYHLSCKTVAHQITNLVKTTSMDKYSNFKCCLFFQL